MSSPQLRRETPKPREQSNLLASVALKAEAMLGYSWLRKRLGIELGSLARTLEELGIEPFRGEDVKQYKKERARMAEHQAYSVYRDRSRRQGFTHLAPGTYVRASWRAVPLQRFEGEVPAFALSRALEIKERMPNAEFEVEELRVEKRYDPFLVARCGRERFYIDVWEEEEFETNHR
jgi:hypothetical protein